MAKDKRTTSKAAKAASKALRSKGTSKKTKRIAGSVLSQKASDRRVTSKKVAKAASQVLTAKKSEKKTKTLAGSALAQRPHKVKGRKGTSSGGPRRR